MSAERIRTCYLCVSGRGKTYSCLSGNSGVDPYDNSIESPCIHLSNILPVFTPPLPLKRQRENGKNHLRFMRLGRRCMNPKPFTLGVRVQGLGFMI